MKLLIGEMGLPLDPLWDILNRKVKDSSAKSNDTRHNSPKLVSISLIPASAISFCELENQDTLRGKMLAPAEADAVVLTFTGCMTPSLFGGISVALKING